MTIAVYVDESGTHDPTGSKKGSREAVFTGLAAPVDEWRVFAGKWQATLNKYRVPNFHFWEWTDAYQQNKKHGTVKNGLFKGLSSNQLNSIVVELAQLPLLTLFVSACIEP